MAQSIVYFRNKKVYAVKKLATWLISNGFRIITIVYSDSDSDGFVVLNKRISFELRNELLDWNKEKLFFE